MMPDFSVANFRKTFEFSEKTKGELRQLIHPYYICNLILAFSFLFLKLTKPFCTMLFATGPVSQVDSSLVINYDLKISSGSL